MLPSAASVTSSVPSGERVGIATVATVVVGTPVKAALITSSSNSWSEGDCRGQNEGITGTGIVWARSQRSGQAGGGVQHIPGAAGGGCGVRVVQVVIGDRSMGVGKGNHA